MTVKELICALQKIENQDAEIILEDTILGTAVQLGFIRKHSTWQANSIDLCGDSVPGENREDWDSLWEDEDDE